MKALNNQQTRELEQWAVDEGIPYITLMEHAGTAVITISEKREL